MGMVIYNALARVLVKEDITAYVQKRQAHTTHHHYHIKPLSRFQRHKQPLAFSNHDSGSISFTGAEYAMK